MTVESFRQDVVAADLTVWVLEIGPEQPKVKTPTRMEPTYTCFATACTKIKQLYLLIKIKVRYTVCNACIWKNSRTPESIRRRSI